MSGDTVYSPSLVKAADRADLLLHDALSPQLLKLAQDALGGAGVDSLRQIFADVPGYQATASRAADAAREAGVGALALTHMIPRPAPQGARAGLPRRCPRAFRWPPVAGTQG